MLVVIVIGLSLGAYFSRYLRARPLDEMPIRHVTLAGQGLALRVAETYADQARGLQGVNALRDTEGMLFPFGRPLSQQFWNDGMIMAFDLLWIRDGRVVGIVPDIPPPHKEPLVYDSPGPVEYAVELPAGWAERYGVRLGDIVLGL